MIRKVVIGSVGRCFRTREDSRAEDVRIDRRDHMVRPIRIVHTVPQGRQPLAPGVSRGRGSKVVVRAPFRGDRISGNARMLVPPPIGLS